MRQSFRALGNTPADIADQFFADLATDSRVCSESNLRAWLWFTCPASMRKYVEAAIRADPRWEAAQRGE